ncbi:MAG: oxidoreductase [Bryobacterales bacterium]|nr:oxidoreductase [Bryobacterales bacterium]
MFRALVVRMEDGRQQAGFEELDEAALPEADVTIRIQYSSLNYKDALAVTGQGRVLRNFPMVPGIDLAGTVVDGGSSGFSPGDSVLVTGNTVGEAHWGGYAQMARVRSAWVIPIPNGLDARRAMAIGTAGFTAMLSVMALEEHGLSPATADPVVVTGAGGGVGSAAVAILSHLGYRTAAVTGREELHGYLRALGAVDLLERREVATASTRGLEKERWAGAVDAVGGEMLAGLLRTMKYGASVAACGLAGGSTLNTTVFPFILRGVNLLGIDSDYCGRKRRLAAWQRLTTDLPAAALERMTSEIGLDEIFTASEQILAGAVRGRTVVRMDA